MDSEHRHELQQNDLQEELKAIGAWIKTNGSKLFFYVALTALIVVGVYKFRQMRDTDQANVLIAYANCAERQDSPDDEMLRVLTDLTQQDTNERVAAQSQLLLGQIRMVQAGNADTAEKTKALRTQAVTKLQGLLGTYASDYPVLGGKAKLALMTIAIDTADFDKAKSLLAEVKDAKLAGDPLANEIAEGEALLKALAAKPVTLAKPAAWMPKEEAKIKNDDFLKPLELKAKADADAAKAAAEKIAPGLPTPIIPAATPAPKGPAPAPKTPEKPAEPTKPVAPAPK